MTDLPPNTPQSAQKTAAPGKNGRWIKVALALSVALNLGFIGLAAGAALKVQRDAARVSGGRDLAFGPYSQALTRDQRRAMLRGMAAGGGDLRKMRGEFQADLDAVLAALRAEPFDAGAFRAALDQQGQRLSSRAADGRKALVDLVAGMSDAERQVFVGNLERRLTERRRRD